MLLGSEPNKRRSLSLGVPLRPGGETAGPRRRSQPHLHKHPNTADVTAPSADPAPSYSTVSPGGGRREPGGLGAGEREPGFPARCERATHAASRLNGKGFPPLGPLTAGGSHLSPGQVGRFLSIYIYKARSDGKSKRSSCPGHAQTRRVRGLGFQSLPSPPLNPSTDTLTNTLSNSWRRRNPQAVLFLGEPRAWCGRKAPLWDHLTQDTSGKKEPGSRETTPP